MNHAYNEQHRELTIKLIKMIGDSNFLTISWIDIYTLATSIERTHWEFPDRDNLESFLAARGYGITPSLKDGGIYRIYPKNKGGLDELLNIVNTTTEKADAVLTAILNNPEISALLTESAKK